MSKSIIIGVDGQYLDSSLPVLQRDAVVRAGSQFVFDMLDDYSNPHGTGALPSGSLLTNLVSGAADAVSSGASLQVDANGAIVFSGTSLHRIDLGTTHNTTADGIVRIAWAKMATNAGNDRGVINLGTGNAVFQYSIESRTGGAEWVFGVENTTRAVAVNDGSVCQLALSWMPDGTIQAFKNGALLGTIVTAITSLTAYPSQSVRVGVDPQSVGFAGTIYRLVGENLSVSGRSALAVVQQDWAENNGRFS